MLLIQHEKNAYEDILIDYIHIGVSHHIVHL